MLTIPELQEAISRYDLDGAWIDGECWATHLDYSDATVRGFREATGLSAPKDAAQPGWQQWKEFVHRIKMATVDLGTCQVVHLAQFYAG
jgi:hypothetical protein